MINFSAVKSLEVSELPILLEKGYKQVEYIRSNGSNAIDTGITPNFSRDMTLAVTFSVAAANSRYCLFGNYRYDSYSFNLEVNNANQLRLYIARPNANQIVDVKAGSIEANRRYTTRFEWIAASRTYELYLDGVLLATGVCDIETQTLTAKIFIDNRPEPQDTFTQPLTIYSFCLANGVTRHTYFTLPYGCNFIPCLRHDGYGEPDAVGLYDLIESNFHALALLPSETASAGATRKSGSVAKIEDASGRVLWMTSALNTGLEFTSSTAFSIEAPSPSWDGRMEYNNGSGWETWGGHAISSSYMDGKHALYIRGIGNTQVTGNGVGWALSGTDISCNGNIEKLLDFITAMVGKHPVMADSCFSGMFQNCESLIAAPSLPATTLADYCYYSMFKGCTNLTTVASLPATELAPSCYSSMFYGCKKILITTVMNSSYPTSYRIPMVGTGKTASSALTNMFANTGGPFIATPSTPNVNTTYFLGESNTIV